MIINGEEISAEEISVDPLIQLHRGGFIVDTPAGYVQFGCPPETIKDSMFLPKGVPNIFVLPEIFFNWSKGISVAEMEFPIYYNFFLRKSPTYIICNQEQYRQFKQVLRESVFGPEHLNLEQDYFLSGNPNLKVPDLQKEMRFFSSFFKLSDMVKFGVFSSDRFTFKGITVQRTKEKNFYVYYEGKKLAQVPAQIDYKPIYDIGQKLNETFKPPIFGVTCLGPSHGFDPNDNTSGFIIWLNHQGIMVDPPVNSTEWLLDSNVNPKLIDSIILTHCHADHDAGTLQKILEEGKITVYTTKTVMESFLCKYSAFCGVSPEYLSKLFDFVPVKVGKPFFIHSGRFEIFYTLHSIPAIGFRLQFQEKSFAYSSDHNNDPELHRKLLDSNIISQERYEELTNFPWNSNVIYHESGIPPLHTPIKYLNSLPLEIQKRLVVYHIAKKDFPDDTDLRLAKFGIENTLIFDVDQPQHEEASIILSILKHLDFLSYIPIVKAQEFIGIVKKETYHRGDAILKKGTTGDRFYIIYSGNVSVINDGLEAKKVYGAYDYFGEVALMKNQPRSADVIAETDVIAYSIHRDEFLNFIADTAFEQTLIRLTKIRDSETWNVLSKSSSLSGLTSTQKTWLESFIVPVDYPSSTEILDEHSQISHLFVIRNGEVEVKKNGKILQILSRGDYIGEFNKIYDNTPAGYSFESRGPVSLYSMKRSDILNFLKHNPGLIMKLRYNFSV